MPRQSKKIQDAAGVHLWLVLWKAYEAVREYALADIASLGLGLSDFAILEMLLNKGPLPVNAIGAKVRLTSGSMTIAVDRLERRGFVERHSDAEDRRARVVHLTAEGRRLIECAFAEHAASLERLAQGLTERERSTLEAALKKLGLTAERLIASAAPRQPRQPA